MTSIIEESLETDLRSRYVSVRAFSKSLVAPLSPDDCAMQSMPAASPLRWHLAHTTWFFETFLLTGISDYDVFDPNFALLFNSYYNAVGEPFSRAQRSLISRPGLHEVMEYRDHVDLAMLELFQTTEFNEEQQTILTIGLHHEQQHQELMLTDLKHAFSMNPLLPAYQNVTPETDETSTEQLWIPMSEGIAQIGHHSSDFSFDNEQPQHRQFLESYQLANRCVTNGEYLEFINNGGYSRPEYWLSLGWESVQSQNWQSPLYWFILDKKWHQFTLAGPQPLSMHDPVCHVSYFEADAYARWAGCRLPTEFEWENSVGEALSNSASNRLQGHWSDELMPAGHCIHPRIEKADNDINDFVNAIGNVWEWTSSQYSPYPGYQPVPGALGEYNGKFMCNQFVLRGGSCATPSGHIRLTYRNFFPPEARWQFSGFRLAK